VPALSREAWSRCRSVAHRTARHGDNSAVHVRGFRAVSHCANAFVCRPIDRHLSTAPNNACTRPPCLGDFPRSLRENAVLLYSTTTRRSAGDASPLGWRLSVAAAPVGLLSACLHPQRVNCCAAHQTASVIFSRRPAVALLPSTACATRVVRMLRQCFTLRFATDFTARHGSFLPCLAVCSALPTSLQGVCAD
jgi:hypothetical protein